MRLSRTDLFPMLAIMGSGAFAVLTVGSLLRLPSPPANMPAPDPVVVPSADLELPLARLEEALRRLERDRGLLSADVEKAVARASEAVESQEIRPEDRAAIRAGPVFTPMIDRPEIRNRNEVVAALMQEYPPPLRIAGIGGQVVVWFYVIETGQVLDARISRSSGNAELDQAALRVAAIIRFTPAQDGNGPVPVWIEVPITFQVRN